MNLATQYVRNQAPSSEGYNRIQGWIYEVLVTRSEIIEGDFDQRLSVDVDVIRRIDAIDHSQPYPSSHS